MTHPAPVQATPPHCQASESPAPRIVRWLDSSLQNGQVDKDDFPTPVVITSVGFVVEETDEHITLARDDMGHDGDYRGLCSIPQRAVLAVRTSAISHAATLPASSRATGASTPGAGESFPAAPASPEPVEHHVQPAPDIESDEGLIRTIQSNGHLTRFGRWALGLPRRLSRNV